jgi:tryptophan 7-halogenase
MPIRDVLVLGGGSAGLMAAITLKRKLPELNIRVIRSPELGVIGVGEGTTIAFPNHFFDYLKLKPQQFYSTAEATWKLGVKFLWGPRKEFHYTFNNEFQQRLPELSRNKGFYYSDEFHFAGPISAFMAQDKAFARRADGAPQFHNSHAFHIENLKLIGWLEAVSRALGVTITDATVTAQRGEKGIESLTGGDGTHYTADLYIDASGFRSELLGRVLGEQYLSYSDALFCDRAIIGGWARTDEPIKPYTVAETMDAGWCWQIEHENWINRGYVYASPFISDEAALKELLQKNPKISNEPRLVKFRSGRYLRNWVGNVVGIGNAVGFVEPLEATALQVICVETSTLADSLIDSLCEPTPTLIELYNRYNAQAWDDIRDFLSVHYKFNTRLDNEFWRACRNDTKLHDAQFLVDFYKENGPSVVAGVQLLHPSNSFGMDGYLTLLVGQNVPHQKPYQPPPAEAQVWKNKCNSWLADARRGLDVKQCLQAIRGSAPKTWTS